MAYVKPNRPQPVGFCSDLCLWLSIIGKIFLKNKKKNKAPPTTPSQFSPTKGKGIEKDGILLSHVTF